jgi:hypothetical protein
VLAIITFLKPQQSAMPIVGRQTSTAPALEDILDEQLRKRNRKNSSG